jgi:8-oxo-dGTP pyrophosphatase MutT (NUDIX family)
MSERPAKIERLLLWLWKVLPLPTRVRRAYLELTHPRFLLGVMALIRDERGRVLILEHTYRREHRWGLPGGYLKFREEPAAGLAREVLEETGLEIEVGDLLAVGLYSPHQLDLLYRARIVSGVLSATPEVCGWRYADEAALDVVLPNQLDMLRRAGLANACQDNPRSGHSLSS